MEKTTNSQAPKTTNETISAIRSLIKQFTLEEVGNKLSNFSLIALNQMLEKQLIHLEVQIADMDKLILDEKAKKQSKITSVK